MSYYHEPGSPYPEQELLDSIGHHEGHEQHSNPIHKDLEEDAFDMLRRILFPESHEEHPGEHATEHLGELLKLLEELGHSEEFLDVLKEVEFYHPGFLEKLRHGHAHEYVEGLFRRHTEESFDPKEWEFDHSHPYGHQRGGGRNDQLRDGVVDQFHEKYQSENYRGSDPFRDEHNWEGHHDPYHDEHTRQDYSRKVPEPKSTSRQSHTDDERGKRGPSGQGEPVKEDSWGGKNWEHERMNEHPWSDPHDHQQPWMAARAGQEHVRNVPEASRSVGVVEDEDDDQEQGRPSSQYNDRPRSTWNAALPPAPPTAVRARQASAGDIIYPGNPVIIENGATLKQSTVIIFIGIVFAIIALVRKCRAAVTAEEKSSPLSRV
ncbi:hypothetical protein FOL47_003031 [Perkinsus chesapeaki]|uniref:Uncharacterized protein n=1 Tax=Perkinsus chesapeaki TaxID=330153 RepID=A0A7J6MA37_PERCH|nr:hypothetical protein FOL47_003031 [Perkinsus chesapeaki]